MNHSWQLIRGACLYRPASNVLFAAVSSAARMALREADESRQAPRTLFSRRAALQKQIEDLEREQDSLARHISRVKDRGRNEEALTWESMWADCNRLYEERRAEAAEVENELEKWVAPLREAHHRDRRHWVRRLMLAGGGGSKACLAHLESIQIELAHEQIRQQQATEDDRFERAAEEALDAMRKSMGLKERVPEQVDVWDWNRHRRSGGGGWNCA